MPTLTRWFLKAGLISLLSALFLAVELRLNLILPASLSIPNGWPVFYHLFFVGWITQIIFGVSIWMFPPRDRKTPRGNPLLGWISFALLNTGLLLRVFSEPFIPGHPSAVFRWMLVISAIFQFIAALIYLGLIWRRVKPKPGKREAANA